tara:strand:+ start:101 stop:286 length:186 start_codon:yes stop_codon:yes gene_type:complete
MLIFYKKLNESLIWLFVLVFLSVKNSLCLHNFIINHFIAHFGSFIANFGEETKLPKHEKII